MLRGELTEDPQRPLLRSDDLELRLFLENVSPRSGPVEVRGLVLDGSGSARALRVGVEATVVVEDSELRVQIRDDGVGGARRDGSGLVGLGDRVAALDGRLRVESPAGEGTLLAANIPLRE